MTSTCRVQVWGVGRCEPAVTPGSGLQTLLGVNFLFGLPVILPSMGSRKAGTEKYSLHGAGEDTHSLLPFIT